MIAEITSLSEFNDVNVSDRKIFRMTICAEYLMSFLLTD